MIFDGKAFARRKLERLLRLPEEKRHKTLAVLVDPTNESGVKYVALKKRVAEEVGVRLIQFPNTNFQIPNEEFIVSLNEDSVIDGIMIQLPFPDSDALIGQIAPAKDVDGLREDSPYLMATVRGIFSVLEEALKSSGIQDTRDQDTKICVVGSRGEVGSRVLAQLHRLEVPVVYAMDSDTFDAEKITRADVIISCAGVQGMFTADMVKDGVSIIDIGFPKGDFNPGVSAKASFYTPVPGGVGPVTVVSLFENLLGV